MQQMGRCLDTFIEKRTLHFMLCWPDTQNILVVDFIIKRENDLNGHFTILSNFTCFCSYLNYLWSTSPVWFLLCSLPSGFIIYQDYIFIYTWSCYIFFIYLNTQCMVWLDYDSMGLPRWLSR